MIIVSRNSPRVVGNGRAELYFRIYRPASSFVPLLFRSFILSQRPHCLTGDYFRDRAYIAHIIIRRRYGITAPAQLRHEKFVNIPFEESDRRHQQVRWRAIVMKRRLH